MHSRIGHHNPTPCRVLNCEPRLTVLPSHSPNCTAEMVPAQEFDVGDLERLDIEVIESEEGDRILDFEAEAVGGYEVGAFLEGAGIECVLGGF